MRNKTAKKLRKTVGYNPNIDKPEYEVEDTSEFLGMIPVGTNPDGTPQLKEVIINKCTISMEEDCKRKQYKKLKESV